MPEDGQYGWNMEHNSKNFTIVTGTTYFSLL